MKNVKKFLSAAMLCGVASAVSAQLPEGFVLFESFEAWDGKEDWTPDGWTVEMKGDVERKYSWTPSASMQYFPTPTDGEYYYGVSFSDDKAQDEWLISPQVDVAAGMVMTFDAWFNPLYLYNTDNVDWDTGEFTGPRTVAATLQVWIRPDGGEWTMLHDFADDYMEMNVTELMTLDISTLSPRSINLDGYAGKKVNVALRYVGIDGNTMLVDAVAIGYPKIDNVSFFEPWYALYYGFGRSVPFSYLPQSIAVYPVYEPITWYNMTDADAAYSWSYEDPLNKGSYLTDNDPEELVVTFEPDYSTDRTKANNFFHPHTLTATAPGCAPTSFSAPYLALQAGGKAEITFNDGTYDEYSFLPFDYNTKDIIYILCEDEKEGVRDIPIFGHDIDGNVDDYWLKYSLGEEAGPDDYSHLIGIGNLFMPSEAPLVVNGLTLYAYGFIEPDAEITAKIYALDAEGHQELNTFTTIATTTCKGSDIIAEYVDNQGLLVLPFDFDEPAVVRATPEHPYYIFMIEGFRSDKVRFFAPFQSYLPDDRRLGYAMYDLDFSSVQPGYKFVKVRGMDWREDINDTNSYANPNSAFAIALNAEYPWLTCDTQEVEIDGETTVALGSYYDGSKLSVSAPEGITATVSGRYDKCVLSLSAHADAEGSVTVSGPGVSVDIKVKASPHAGINEVITDKDDADGIIYDLQGRKLLKPRQGLYIQGGKIRKI